ncbi:MAG: hypothetical protein H6810_11325 [Phycisphaeraceae bacterium]|nr:MAG: hypothetical protein H6810_11325 [Phycisphaeraceae bacterium]
MKTRVMLAGLALFAAPAFAGTNLLLNPSFEEPGNPLIGEGPFASWSVFNNVFSDESIDLPAYDGLVSCKMYGGFFGPGVQSDTGAYQTVSTPAAAGKNFRASVTVQSLSSDPLAPLDFGDADGNGSFGHLPLLLMQFRDINGNQISQPEVTVFDAAVDPFDQWITRSVEAIAPAGTEEINIFCLFIQFGDDPGSLYWDSVSLEEVAGGPDCTGQDDPVKLVDDSTAPWLGYMNISELDGTYLWGSAWGIPDLTATFDDNVPSVTMSPAEIDDPDPYWYIGGGAPGAAGNKLMEANLYEQVQGCISGQTVTYSGYVQENTLDSAYTASIYIRDFASDYSSFNETRVNATPGAFSISLDTVDDPARVVQWGFTLVGPNVWPGDAAALGSVTYSSVAGTLGCNDADLSAPYGLLDLSDINAFISGFVANDPIADINGDGLFDLADINGFVSAFLTGCP